MNMRTSFIIKVMCVGIVISIVLINGCTKKKTTSPIEPVSYLMKDYFPINNGDEWIWEQEWLDSIPEPFEDGDINLGEPFTDSNHNGHYDFGETYEDLNFNGKYDSSSDPWTPGIPYVDKNNDGDFDYPNYIWDEGEPFTDLDFNEIWNWIYRPHIFRQEAAVRETTSLSPEGSMVFYRRSHSFEIGVDSISEDKYRDDGFSNDTLGLRWHSHTDIQDLGLNDDLRLYGTVTIARASIQINDSVVHFDTSFYPFTPWVRKWISVFEGVEDVTISGANFPKCLKFKFETSGWVYSMKEYNGTSYQWYAKHVGMVKSEGPKEGEYWILKSAKVGGKNYP